MFVKTAASVIIIRLPKLIHLIGQKKVPPLLLSHFELFCDYSFEFLDLFQAKLTGEHPEESLTLFSQEGQKHPNLIAYENGKWLDLFENKKYQSTHELASEKHDEWNHEKEEVELLVEVDDSLTHHFAQFVVEHKVKSWELMIWQVFVLKECGISKHYTPKDHMN